MTRSLLVVRNILSNWVVLAANVVYALFVTPIIVRALDTELYGVWSFLNIVVGYSELLYFGLGSALVKHIAQARATSDAAGVNRLTSVVASIYVVLGLLCLALLSAASPIVPQLFAEPLTADAAWAASVTAVLLGVRLLTVFIGSAFAGVLAGHDRYDLVNAVYLGSIVLRFVATPLLLGVAPSPLVMLALLTAAVGTLEAIALATTAFRLLPALKVTPARPERRELAMLYGFGLQAFLIVLAVKLISHTDLTVIGITLGAASVALYAIPLQLVEYARAAVGGFSSVFLPQLTIHAVRGDLDALRWTLVRCGRVAFFLAAWFVGALIALGPEFLTLWVGAEFAASARWLIVWLGLTTAVHVFITQVPLAFYQALHLMALPAKILVLEGVVNIGLSFALAPRWGIVGVAFATAVPAVLVSFVILPRYLCHALQLSVRHLLVHSMSAGTVLLAAILVTQWGIRDVFPHSYAGLAARALFTVPLALATFVFMFPADDRQTVLRLWRSVRPAAIPPRSTTSTE